MIRMILMAFFLFLAIGCPKDPPAQTDMSLDMGVFDLTSDLACSPHKKCGQDTDCRDTICAGVCIGGECVYNP